MKKRILSLALTLVLAFASVPAFAPPAAAGQSMPIPAATVASGSGNYAIKPDGSLWAWGDGYLGNGKVTYMDDIQIPPVKIMDNVVSIVSCQHGKRSYAIKTDGSLWGWGENNYRFNPIGIDSSYFPGNNIKEPVTTPLKILDNVVSVMTDASNHAMAIKTDGSLWVWGGNAFGLFTTPDIHGGSSVPVKIMDNVVSAAVGETSFFAVKTDGSLWSWGGNFRGMLGIGRDGDSEDKVSTPSKVMDNVVSVAAGEGAAMAVKTDGSLWAWGYGNIGDGKDHYESRVSPVKIMEDVAYAQVSHPHRGALMSLDHMMAIKTDGSLWVWGQNDKGQLGTGTYTIYDKGGAEAGRGVSWSSDSQRKDFPFKVMDDVAFVTGGNEVTMALKADGSIWGWGDNYADSLAGASSERLVLTPVKMMDGIKTPTLPGPLDSASPWAREFITAALDSGILPPSLQNNYTRPCTRAEFCAFAVALIERATGEEIAERIEFNDTDDVNVQKIGGLEIVTGVGNGHFSPDRIISRQEAAIILVRVARIGLQKPLPEGVDVAFHDLHLAWDEATVSAIRRVSATNPKIMSGKLNNLFDPLGNFTREESITTMVRLWEFYNAP